MWSLAAVPGQAIVCPREIKVEMGAGSSCTMHLWIRNDRGHELFSTSTANPRAGSLDSCTKALCMSNVWQKAAERGNSQVCQESVPSPIIQGPLVLLFFSSHSINNSNAHS